MRKLVCIGGGYIPRYMNGVLLPYETKEIDEEIVKLANRENPKFLFISIASAHPDEYFEGIKKVYEKLGCIVSHLNPDDSYEELEKEVFNTDIIYVGGGDTRFLLEQLKKKGLDKLLIQAYNQGIVCSGWSAGSYCWFKYNYDMIEGMDVIKAVNCVHYDKKDAIARNKFYEVVKHNNLVGYAIENQVAIEFIDDNINVIKSNTEKEAYKISFIDNKFIEEKLR